MERLDRLAVAHGLEIRQMMELAGFHMATLFKVLRVPSQSAVTVVCGKGNKGGDGLSATRHLINHGWNVTVVLMSREISDDARHHLKLLEKMRVPIVLLNNDESKARATIQNANVIIDALIGYHLAGSPRPPFDAAIAEINAPSHRVIAYDLPSGMDATNGHCLGACVKAESTLTLALPKRAFQNSEARTYYGDLYLADIGIPNFLYDEIANGARPPFQTAPHGFIRLEQ
ncbi:MAG: NAD(P)H-hydrate epimerase [Parcubacteria group bacterium]|nr:NAD(P)H-hydrate epimerase [Parcubacteria group bacterium]